MSIARITSQDIADQTPNKPSLSLNGPYNSKVSSIVESVLPNLGSDLLEELDFPFSIQPPSSREEKMYKNGKKAIEEHVENYVKNATYTNKIRKNEPDFLESLPCLIPKTILPSILPPLESILSAKDFPIDTICSGNVLQGCRPYMEDRSFAIETDKEILVAVLDGHGGKNIAKKSAVFFKNNFMSYLAQAGGSVGDAFADLFQDAAKLAKEYAYLEEGSTAVLCYVDKITHAVYTATLGDSEARLYRRSSEDGSITSIPLSCVRDWSSKSDAKRAAKQLKIPLIAERWPLEKCSKELRVAGLNVSRSLGDSYIDSVSNKPKLSLNQVKPGDYVVVASDGVWDYLFENEIAEKLFEETAPEDKAKKLSSFAVESSKYPDNTTAIVIKII